MSMSTHEPRFLTVAEVAKRLHVSEDTVRRRIASGDLPAVQFGGRRSPVRVDERELEQYVYGDDAA